MLQFTFLENRTISSLCFIMLGFAALVIENERSNITVKPHFFQHSRQNVDGPSGSLSLLLSPLVFRAWLLIN